MIGIESGFAQNPFGRPAIDEGLGLIALRRCRPLTKPHSRTSTVFVNEYHSLAPEHLLDPSQSLRVASKMAELEVCNRISVKPACIS